MNTSYVYPSAQVGEFRQALLYASGPTSYTPFTGAGVGGDSVYNPGSCEYINFPSDATTLSGNYRVRFVPTAVGSNQVRAGGGVGGPSVSGWTAVWEFAGASNFPQIGIPLTLGTLSAAATQSTFTANGVCTVLTTTPPPTGSFILLTNGASAAGIFLNGAIVYVTASVAGTSYTFNFAAAKALNYTIATDTLKWQRVYGGNTSNPVALGTASTQSIAVSAVAVASNVLTITCTNTGTAIAPGNFCLLQGLAAGEVPQGGIIQVLTASTTSITANFIAPNLSVTSGETATLTVLTTGGNAPIQATLDSFGINGTTVAATAASSSAAGAVTVLPVGQTLIPGNLVIVQGLSHGSSLNGLTSAVLSTGLTGQNVELNGYIITGVTTGTADIGAIGLLETGIPLNGLQVASGTNLNGEQIQFGAVVSSL